LKRPRNIGGIGSSLLRGCGAWVDGISDSTRCIPEVEHPWIGPFETLKEAFTDCIKIRARRGRRRDL